MSKSKHKGPETPMPETPMPETPMPETPAFETQAPEASPTLADPPETEDALDADDSPLSREVCFQGRMDELRLEAKKKKAVARIFVAIHIFFLTVGHAIGNVFYKLGKKLQPLAEKLHPVWEKIRPVFRKIGEVFHRFGQSFEKNRQEIFFVIVMILSITLLSVVFVLTDECARVQNDRLESRAALNSTQAVDSLNQKMSQLKSQAVGIDADLAEYRSETALVLGCMEQMRNTKHLQRILLCKDGEIRNYDGGAFNGTKQAAMVSAMEAGEVTVLGIINDLDEEAKRLAICVPAREGSLADGEIFLYSPEAFGDVPEGIRPETMEKMAYLAVCGPDGEVIRVLIDNESLELDNVNVVNDVQKMTGKKEHADTTLRYLSIGQNEVIRARVHDDSYAISVAVSPYYRQCAFVVLYDEEVLCGGEYNFINVILSSLIIVLLAVFLFSVYFIVSKHLMNRKISNFGTTDEQLECFNRIGFEREAGKMLERYKGSRFAVISAGIRRYEYIAEVAGAERAQELLRRVRGIINGGMQLGETYGHDGQGEFLILLHYGQYERLVRRLREIYRLAYNSLTTSDYNVKLNFGICTVEPGNTEPVRQLVSNAKLAMNNGGLEKMGGNYTLYDDSIRSTYLKISDVEIKMDQGIRNHEFRVFYQPKYNVSKERIDGCEALVRWYDEASDQYRPPDTFLPLLEANGFISRLDHYVFLEVCKFINECVTNGVSIIPISVNVSRMTALEPDFVDYYVNLKKQYQIPNHFITLEFTESVAYDNYTSLTLLVRQLRSAGFECSIDDFGTGYSSYNMLKQLEIDEVKLDKFFIEGCLSSQRARYILEGAISIANNLQIKVTQEGVEDAETFNYLKKLGCNVIQGFYYSRPLEKGDFLDFVRDQLRRQNENPSGDKGSGK